MCFYTSYLIGCPLPEFLSRGGVLYELDVLFNLGEFFACN